MTTVDIVFPTPDEVEGFWAFDKMHAPRPLRPLSQDLVMTTLGEGFTLGQADYDCPLAATARAFNNYFYMAFHPVPDEAELMSRVGRYHDTLAAKVPGIGQRWLNEWKPQLIERNVAEKSVDYSTMSDAELDAKLHDMTQWMRDMWTIHGHINFVLISGAQLSDFYDEVIQSSDPTEAYQILQGHHTRSVDAARGIWDLSRKAVNTPEIKALFETYVGLDLYAKLDESAAGQAFKVEFEEYLHEYGWRSDAVYDLGDLPWRENPTIPLGNVGMYMAFGDDMNPEVQYKRSVALREELMGRIRTKLADDSEKLAHFETLYEAAQYSYPITEDHAFYIDQLGVVLLRRFCRSVGDRFVERGYLDDPEDVFFLHANEVHDTLTAGGDRRGLVAERKAHWEACGQVTPPGALGIPPVIEGPPDPFFDAVGSRLLGIKPPPTDVDPLVIDGVPGSPGVYKGVARVVRSLTEAGDLEDGEVMVCEMTLPPWVPMFAVAGAVVADVGGIMSHCAIVAREFDIPAVVGSVDGTTRITTGMIVTVDGTNGNVYLDARDL